MIIINIYVIVDRIEDLKARLIRAQPLNHIYVKRFTSIRE
jgi:hypothetical protein